MMKTHLLFFCMGLPAVTMAGGKAETFKLRSDDVVYPKLSLVFGPNETVKSLEKTTFDSANSSFDRDRCEVRLRQPATEQRAIGRLKIITQAHVQTIAPKFEKEKFITALQSFVPKLFSKMIQSDQVEGIVFRRDDLRDHMGEILDQEPLSQIPRTYRTRLEQSLVTNLWGCYGDLIKFKNHVSRGLINRYHHVWGQRLVDDLASSIQEPKKRSLASDQISKTKISMDLKQAKVGAPDPGVSIECVFQGSASEMTFERLNAVLSPYFEVFPKATYEKLFNERALPFHQSQPASERGELL